MQETPRAKRRRFRRFARYLNGLDKAKEGDHLDLARWMRVHKTPGEKEVWRTLRRLNRENTRRLGRGVPRPKWRCQTPKYGFIADFYCPFLKLALEVDGASHRTPEGAARDARKDAAFAKHGIKVVRLPWPFVKSARLVIAGIIDERARELEPVEPDLERDQDAHMEALAAELREARSSTAAQSAEGATPRAC